MVYFGYLFYGKTFKTAQHLKKIRNQKVKFSHS